MPQLKINSTNQRWYSLEDLPNEVWKDIKGYEGLYQISDYGRIKSFYRTTTHTRILKERTHRDGYLYVGLYKNGKTTTAKSHRLVALYFIPNPENKPQVNHKDGNKLNNNVENLEWCTAAENARHAVDTGLWVWTEESKRKLKETLLKKGYTLHDNTKKKRTKQTKDQHTRGHGFGYVQVVQKTDEGDIVKIWRSMSDASRELGIPVPHIVRVCKGRRKHTGGYMWEYYNGGDSIG